MRKDEVNGNNEVYEKVEVNENNEVYGKDEANENQTPLQEGKKVLKKQTKIFRSAGRRYNTSLIKYSRRS